MYREDYERAGIRMLPVVQPERRSHGAADRALRAGADPCQPVPSLLGMSGKIYFFGALVLGLWFLYSGVRVAFDRTILRARAVLLVSVHLPSAHLRPDVSGPAGLVIVASKI